MNLSKQTYTNSWPELPLPNSWEDTLNTVHMWSQIIGKIRLELNPWINHSWGATLYVSANGLTTSAMPYQNLKVEIEFNFIDHKLKIVTSKGTSRTFALKSMTVGEFYRKTITALNELGIEMKIFTRPVEIEDAIPFEDDVIHKSYDAEIVNRFWQALVQTNRVFNQFRAEFIGKSSPVHFFWGAFDLAVTRFSGRAPKHPGGVPNCADWVMEEAYSHHLSSAGFWAGPGMGEPAFYSYIYPAPDGYSSANIKPDAAYYHGDLGEFILPYHVVQSAENPDSVLLDFLQSTYVAGADLGKWDRVSLEKQKTK